MKPLALCFLLGTGAAATACHRRVDLQQPTLRDPFSTYLSSRLGHPDPLPACRWRPLDLGPTAPAQLRRLRLVLELPNRFLVGPRELLVDSLRHPAAAGLWGGNQWLPGFYVEPVWYRWTRADQLPDKPVGAPISVLQLTQSRGYPPFLAEPPWTLGEGEECALPLGDRTARVLRFTARHPSQPPQWGAVAFWRGRPDDGFIALFLLGPEPAVQGEFLEIIRRHRP